MMSTKFVKRSTLSVGAITLGALTTAAVLFATPHPAEASSNCKVESVEHVSLDADQVRLFKVSIGPDKLKLSGHSNDTGELRIRKCASSDERLKALQARQVKQGATLGLELDYGGRSNTRSSIFGFMRRDDYGYFEISGVVPEDWNLDVAVGSGDAKLRDVAAVNLILGSGDAELERIAGEVTATIGSGDLEVNHSGTVNIASIGSGDLEAEHIAGSVHIGSIGSGTAELESIGGDVTVGNIGSGRLRAEYVAGDVSIGSVGSGRINAHNIEGDFTLRSKGSGSVSVNQVKGTVRVPNR